MTGARDDTRELAGYVEVWWQAVQSFADLLDDLPAEAWATPTDLPGWDVRAVASHVAHLEGATAGAPAEQADIGEPDHVRTPMSEFTEIGVVTRRTTPPAEIVAEIRRHAAARHEALLADPPRDGSAPAPGRFGAIGWTTRLLLRNRPLDVWMHEQDVRRAVGRPGNLDSAAADHTADYLLASLGYVLAKRVGAPPGTTLVAEVAGSAPVAYGVGDDGRGTALAEPPDAPSVVLRMDRATFVRLAGGRGTADDARVTVVGDRALGKQVLASLAVTP